jgi:hypothetical protein
MVGWLTRIPIEGWSVGQRPFFDHDHFWSCLLLFHSARATYPVSLLEDIFYLTELNRLLSANRIMESRTILLTQFDAHG